MKRIFLSLIVLVVLCVPLTAQAANVSPGQIAETMRTALLQAQLDLPDSATTAASDFSQAKTQYDGAFAKTIAAASPDADARVRTGLGLAQTALTNKDVLALADARAQVCTALLAGSNAVVEKAITTNDIATADMWLPPREFRRATRLTRPSVDATNALLDFEHGTLNATDTVSAVRAEMFDTYQARLTVALNDTLTAEKNQYGARRAESVSLAAGYFEILTPAYTAQRGQAQTQQAEQAFTALRDTARQNRSIAEQVNALNTTLEGFRAAPLSPAEQARRAGQFQRFLNLVPVEYGRGVSAGIVTSDLEIQEASTFRDGAAAAFADVRSILEARDAGKTKQIAALLDQLQTNISDTGSRTKVVGVSEIQRTTDQIKQLIAAVSPAEWA